MNTAKWIVDKCNQGILSDCINKNLTINSIVFNDDFDKPIGAFNKFILADISINPSKPSPAVRTFDKLSLVADSINPSKPSPNVHIFSLLQLAGISIIPSKLCQ